MMDRRCVLVCGAEIARFDRILPRLRPDDFFLYCDGGLRHLGALQRKPDLIVGDFDSFSGTLPDAETIALPREKDDTDSVFGAKEAIRRGFSEFLLIGAFGGRLDHTLGNLSLLLYLDGMKKSALALDDFSETEIVSRAPAYVESAFSYFSLLNISGIARGVTVENAKYPLQNASITAEYPYGISNEPLPGKTARITVGEGRLALIRVY